MARMIYFENVNYLFLAGIIPVMLGAYFLNRRRQLRVKLEIGDERLVNNLIIGSSSSLSLFKFILLLSAFAAFIIALANPLSLIETRAEVDFTKTEIVFAVDASKSMLATDVAPNRLQHVQSLILKTVNALNSEQVGMVIFAGKASAYVPFTTDYAYVNSATKSISNNMVLKQGTSLTDALKISSAFFNTKNKNLKVLCILSDGESHSHGFEKLSDSLRKTGINLFAFGAGTTAGATLTEQIPDGTESLKKDNNGLPVISRLNEENLLRITGNNADHYFRLTDNEIAGTAFIIALRKLEYNFSQKQLGTKSYFQLFLIIGLVLLILELLLAPNYVYRKG
jgi:Ca-activated chloride channel family protein